MMDPRAKRRIRQCESSATGRSCVAARVRKLVLLLQRAQVCVRWPTINGNARLQRIKTEKITSRIGRLADALEAQGVVAWRKFVEPKLVFGRSDICRVQVKPRQFLPIE